MKSKLLLLVMLVVVLGVSSAQAATILSFQSSPESWVGQGQSFTVTPDDGYIFNSTIGYYWDNNIRFTIDSLNSPFGPDWNPNSGEEYHWWVLWISAPFDQPFEVGFYDNANTYSIHNTDQPGLSFSGDHCGENHVSGFFEIFDISFDQDGNLERLAVDFTQYGEIPGSWLTGQLRYNSDIPISNVPVPAGIWLLGSGGAVLMGLRKKRQRSK